MLCFCEVRSGRHYLITESQKKFEELFCNQTWPAVLEDKETLKHAGVCGG